MLIFVRSKNWSKFASVRRWYNTNETTVTETHYQVLGLSQYATKQEIVAKYRDLIRIHHPDKHSGSSEEEKHTEIFKKCKEAHEILTNEGSRADYDKKIGVPKRYKSKFLQMTEKNKKPKIKIPDE